jgi:hypothetical protein
VTPRERAAVHSARPRWLLPLLGMTLLFAATIAVGLLGDARAAYGIPRYSTRYSRAAIRTEAKAAHYGTRNTAALLHLAWHESRWHNFSHSRRSECHGLFQLSKGMAHGHPWWQPRWNTRRAIYYIRHRYGTPARALAHSHRCGWY